MYNEEGILEEVSTEPVLVKNQRQQYQMDLADMKGTKMAITVSYTGWWRSTASRDVQVSSHKKQV